MLMPKKVKFRKQQRGRMCGKAWRGSDLSFGDYGLKVMECGYITDRQIEASRIAMTRFIKRGGKVWLRLFPDKPITKKPKPVWVKVKALPITGSALFVLVAFCSRWKASALSSPKRQCVSRPTSFRSRPASSSATMSRRRSLPSKDRGQIAFSS
jgi:hypothetical protein